MATSEVDDLTKKLGETTVDSKHELSFKGKGLKLDKKDDAQVIVDEIEKCGTMKSLCLEGNTVGVEAAEAIAGALEKHPEFQRALWSDMFTGRLKSEIPPALKHLGAAMIGAGAQLAVLDLSDNAFGPNGVEGIVDLLKSKTCYTLKELRLNNNGLGTTGGKMLANCLMECYKSSSSAGTPLALEVFISGRGRLENEGSKALSEVFKLMGSLEEVAMPQNGINFEGIAALSEAFSCNPKLRVLNLNDNTFTEKGAKAMAKVLPKLQNLEVINFGDCLVRTEGARVLAKSLADGHKKLRELVLSGNEIGKSGANAVAESMEDKPNLEILDLDCNQLGEEGIEILNATLDCIGKLDALASLSGDEGSEDEDEEHEETYEEEESAEEEVEGEPVDDPELQVKGKALSPNQTDIDDVEKTVERLFKMSCTVTQDDEKTKKSVCECSDEILEKLFESQSYNDGALIVNAYLVYMGLLKGEDKKYKPPSDITGPLTVLEHCIRQTYFTKHARRLVSAVIEKPHPLLDNKSSSIRNTILQTLNTT